MTACAYAEAALLNGTTTIFCDSHEIGNVNDIDGIGGEAILDEKNQVLGTKKLVLYKNNIKKQNLAVKKAFDSLSRRVKVLAK